LLSYGSDAGSVSWLLYGRTPFYVAGVFAYARRPDHASTRWLLTMGTAYSVSSLAEYGLNLAVAHAAPGIWAIDLGYLWTEQVAAVAGLGFIGLFPVGRTERAHERWILRVFIVAAILLPVLLMLSRPSLTFNRYTFRDFPVLESPLYVSLLSPVGAIANAVYDASLVFLFVAIVAMLVPRYRRAQDEQRRQIQWLLLGVVFGVMGVIAWTLPPLREYAPGSIAAVLYIALAVVGNGGMIACILIGLLRAGLLDISRILVKSLVYGTLWMVIALGYAGTAAVLGLAASQRLPVGVAVLLTIVAAMLFQPARRSLERLAGRWVFGVRESRYDVLTRFGAALEEAGGLDDLLPHLAETARRGLGLRWARVRLDPSDNDTCSRRASPAPARGARPRPRWSSRSCTRAPRSGTLSAGRRSRGRSWTRIASCSTTWPARRRPPFAICA
jgi:hypothetical protein